MDRHTTRERQDPFTRQAATLNVITSYGSLAPALLRMNETQQDEVAAAAQRRLIAAASHQQRARDAEIETKVNSSCVPRHATLTMKRTVQYLRALRARVTSIAAGMNMN